MLHEKSHRWARSTSGTLRARRGLLKAQHHQSFLYLNNRPFTDVDTAAILNSIVLNKILWDAQGGRCMHVLGENLVLVQNVQTRLIFSYFLCLRRGLVAWIRVRHFRTGTCSVFVLLLCILLKSNHTTFLVQFGNNLHSWVFQKAQIAFALRAHAIFILFEKPTCANNI